MNSTSPALLFPLLLLLATTSASVQAGALHCADLQLPGSASCVDRADGITVTLMGHSTIQWNNGISVPAGETVIIQSAPGGNWSSLHTTNLRVGSRLDGKITADGPLSILNKRGLTQGAVGEISAPSVFLSTHSVAEPAVLLDRPTATSAFTENPASSGVTLNGSVTAASGSLVVLSHRVTVNQTAKLEATKGRVELDAGRNGVTGNRDQLTVAPQADGDAGVTNIGSVQAPQIYLVGQGYARNGGNLVSTGNAGTVSLTAPALRNETKGTINTVRLVTNGQFTNEGKVIVRNDGSNPGGVTTVRQVPSLSQNKLTDQTVTRLEATRLNYNQLQEVKFPSLVGRSVKASGPQLAVRQGEGTNNDAKKKTVATAVTTEPKKGDKIVRRGFFGTVGAK